MQKNKILMISPKFFSIEKHLKAAFERQGYDVIFFDERIDNRKLTKAVLRKFPIFMKRKIDNYYNDIYDLIDYDVEMIFVIKAESVPVWFLKKVKDTYPHIKLLHYMYDPILNYPKILSKKDYFDLNLTFDYTDSKKYGWHFRPLFIPPSNKKDTEKKLQSNKGVFIGTLHTDRAQVINRIKNSLPQGFQDNLFIYFYTPLWIMFVWGKYITGEYKNITRYYVHKTPLSSNKVAQIVSESNYVIDLHHDNQTGLTFRTMEVLGAKKKMITTNPNIVKYDFYNPNNILVINKENPIIDESWFSKKYVDVDFDIYKKYTVEGFAKEVLSLAKDI